jgi:ubiquinone/menaquinone biosynthesis C-methylase UbiE
MRTFFFVMTFVLILNHSHTDASTALVLKSTNLEEIETHSYLISTGGIDLERLTILNELYNPSSLKFLKIEPGMKILTIGCGIGLLEIEMAKEVGIQGEIWATDISPLQLAIDKKNQEQASILNLIFQELDVAQINFIPEQFDRIHCRFVLSHMPWNSIEKILPILMRKLTPSGALAIEEITTIDSLYCEPYSEEYELWKGYVNMQFNAQGSDRSPGNHLYDYLQGQGYEFEYETHQPILMKTREKKILSLGIRSIAQGLIDKNLASPDQISEAIERLKNLEDDQGILPRYCETSQFFIKH